MPLFGSELTTLSALKVQQPVGRPIVDFAGFAIPDYLVIELGLDGSIEHLKPSSGNLSIKRDRLLVNFVVVAVPVSSLTPSPHTEALCHHPNGFVKR